MASTKETVITIDDVVVSSNKDLYESLGVKKRKATEETVEKKGFEKIGKIISSSVLNTSGLEAKLGASGISSEEKEDIKKVCIAYKILSNPYCKAAYDANKKSLGAGFNITVDGESINIRDDFYTLLDLSEGKINPEELQIAVNEKLGSIYHQIEGKERFLTALNIRDKDTIKDIENAIKILGNDNNRDAYDRWCKNTEKETKQKIISTTDGSKIASIGKKALIGVSVAALAAAIIVGSYFLGKNKSTANTNNDNDDEKANIYEFNLPSFIVNDNNSEVKIDENAFIDPNNAEQVEKRALAQLNALKANGINVRIPDGNGNERDLNQKDIEGLIYWCSYPYLNNDNLKLASDMDTAAELIFEICESYDRAGLTSQIIAGISDVPADPNIGSYNFDFGAFFPDGTIQQQKLSEFSANLADIKNDPSKANGIASDIYKNATTHFVFDNDSMEMDNAEYNTANFVYGMALVTSQTLFDSKPSFEMDNVTYNNYGALTDLLNSVDGPINAAGRDISTTMATASLGLECNN